MKESYTNTRYITVTIRRQETRAERARRIRMERIDRLCTGLFCFVGILALIFVAVGMGSLI